jgi:adenylate kinase family enzyme
MERVLILGGCGAGKSVFARRLGALLDLPVIHLDAEYFQPGWVEPDHSAWRARVAELVAAPRWIIDGSHIGTLPARLPHADTVIILDLPTWICVWRVLLRIARGYGRVRPDSAPGCPERFDLEFLAFTAAFRRRQRQRIVSELSVFSGRIITLESRREISAFLLSGGVKLHVS